MTRRALYSHPRKKTVKYYPGLIIREKLEGWQSTTRATFEDERVEFLRMVGGETVALADAWSGIRAVEIAQAVYRSATEGIAVTLAKRACDSRPSPPLPA